MCRIVGTRLGAASISAGVTLKAIALKSGWTDSAVISGTFSDAPAVAMPTYNPGPGAYPASDYPKTITISTATAGANIRYTTDGTTPTATAGQWIGASSGTASVPGGATLNAIAFRSDMTNSGVASGLFSSAGAVAVVDIADPGDVYPSTKYVTMTTATAGATIFYTSSTTGWPADPTHRVTGKGHR